jgi:hypothetical protein
MDWARFDETVDRHRARLLSLASDRPVVKDPRFSWTLPVWAAAGVPIEQVVVCLRDLSAMEASREAAGHSWFNGVALRNSLVYAVGLTMTTVHEHALPHAVLRFPDFLEQPADLHRRLVFPGGVEQDEIAEALTRLRRPELVHHRS